MTGQEMLEVVRRYYDGCNAGDVDAMVATFTDEVVHYFLEPNPGSAAVRGAEHLARYWRRSSAPWPGGGWWTTASRQATRP